MIGSIDSGLEFFREVLELRAYRQEILSADIANASTPGFKAVDLDFAEALRDAEKTRSSSGPSSAPRKARVWLVDDARHIGQGGGKPHDGLLAEAAGSVKYQTDNEVTLDGNSVNLDREKVAAAENAVHYEAVATFAAQSVKMMLIAINGSGPQSGGA